MLPFLHVLDFAPYAYESLAALVLSKEGLQNLRGAPVGRGGLVYPTHL